MQESQNVRQREGQPLRPAPMRQGRGKTSAQDPVNFWLLVAVMGILVLWLAGVVSALFFGLFNIDGAPRTQVERDLDYYESKVEAGKVNGQIYASYIDALRRAGQLSKAENAVSQALKTYKTDRSYLYSARAQILVKQKQYSEAVEAANQAMAEAKKEMEKARARNKQANRTVNAGVKMPASYGTAALAKADAALGSKNYKLALEALDAYLETSGTDSDVLTKRGEVKIQLGDKAGAQADFKKALEFIPDYQPALKGLKQIGATQ